MLTICVIIVLVFVIIAFGVINLAYKKTNHFCNSRIDIKQFLDGMPYELSIVNTGSTYSKFAFASSEELQINWGDYSLQSQSLEMDEAILKQYIGHVKKNGVVVVVVAAACLLLYRENGTNVLYYDILKKSSNPIYKKKVDIKRKLPLLTNPKSAIRIFLDDMPIDSVYDMYPSNMSEKDGQSYLKHLVEVWKELFKLDNLKDTNFSDANKVIMKKNVEHLKSIIDCCIDNDTIPVLVIPPFSKRLNCFFSDEFKETVLNNNIYEAIDGRDILFFDYQNDEFFNNRPELFIDGGFRLNRHGSTLFVKKLLEDLKKNDIRINNGTER